MIETLDRLIIKGGTQIEAMIKRLTDSIIGVITNHRVRKKEAQSSLDKDIWRTTGRIMELIKASREQHGGCLNKDVEKVKLEIKKALQRLEDYELCVERDIKPTDKREIGSNEPENSSYRFYYKAKTKASKPPNPNAPAGYHQLSAAF